MGEEIGSSVAVSAIAAPGSSGTCDLSAHCSSASGPKGVCRSSVGTLGVVKLRSCLACHPRVRPEPCAPQVYEGSAAASIRSQTTPSQSASTPRGPRSARSTNDRPVVPAMRPASASASGRRNSGTVADTASIAVVARVVGSNTTSANCAPSCASGGVTRRAAAVRKGGLVVEARPLRIQLALTGFNGAAR